MDILQVVFMNTGLGHISTFAEKAVQYGKEKECVVLFKFNGILLNATPSTSVENVLNQYQTAHALRHSLIEE